MALTVKICGVTTPDCARAAVEAGADMIGFVFFPNSPRNLSISQACGLAEPLAGRAQKVALVVNANDAALDEIARTFKPDWLQLHGTESMARVSEIRKRFGIPILKACGVSQPADLTRAEDCLSVADRLLLDAKPPGDGVLPGGNGLAFDWTLARGFSDRCGTWLLAGGLDPENVGEAIRLTRAPGVDVSSGVEDAPGRKSVEKIHAFVAAARLAQDQLALTARSV
jgi:phosphoribosylanthranilate isomerase